MDLFKKIKLWRGIGQVLNSRIGSSISQAITRPMNQMVSLAVSSDNDDIPWSPLKKTLTKSSLAIVSTAGFYLDGDKPFDIDSARGEAGFRKIPSDMATDAIRIAHTHYPHMRVRKDINVLFPVDRLKEIAKAGVIGKLAPFFYSFGFGGDMVEEFTRVPDGSAHRLARKLKKDDVDVVIMIPA